MLIKKRGFKLQKENKDVTTVRPKYKKDISGIRYPTPEEKK